MANIDHLNSLPDEMIKQIFYHLPSEDLWIVAKISDKFFKLASEEMSTRMVNLGVNRRNASAEVYNEFLSENPPKLLRILNADGKVIAKILPNCAQLTYLIISCYAKLAKYIDMNLMKDFKLISLEKLSLINETDLEQLTKIGFFNNCPRLRYLDFSCIEECKSINRYLQEIPKSLTQLVMKITKVHTVNDLILPFIGLWRWSLMFYVASEEIDEELQLNIPDDIRHNLMELSLKDILQYEHRIRITFVSRNRTRFYRVKVITLRNFIFHDQLLNSIATLFPNLQTLNLINVLDIKMKTIISFVKRKDVDCKIYIFNCKGIVKKPQGKFQDVKVFKHFMKFWRDPSDFQVGNDFVSQLNIETGMSPDEYISNAAAAEAAATAAKEAAAEAAARAAAAAERAAEEAAAAARRAAEAAAVEAIALGES